MGGCFSQVVKEEDDGGDGEGKKNAPQSKQKVLLVNLLEQQRDRCAATAYLQSVLEQIESSAPRHRPDEGSLIPQVSHTWCESIIRQWQELKLNEAILDDTELLPQVSLHGFWNQKGNSTISPFSFLPALLLSLPAYFSHCCDHRMEDIRLQPADRPSHSENEKSELEHAQEGLCLMIQALTENIERFGYDTKKAGWTKIEVGIEKEHPDSVNLLHLICRIQYGSHFFLEAMCKLVCALLDQPDETRLDVNQLSTRTRLNPLLTLVSFQHVPSVLILPLMRAMRDRGAAVCCGEEQLIQSVDEEGNITVTQYPSASPSDIISIWEYLSLSYYRTQELFLQFLISEDDNLTECYLQPYRTYAPKGIHTAAFLKQDNEQAKKNDPCAVFHYTILDHLTRLEDPVKLKSITHVSHTPDGKRLPDRHTRRSKHEKFVLNWLKDQLRDLPQTLSHARLLDQFYEYFIVPDGIMHPSLHPKSLKAMRDIDQLVGKMVQELRKWEGEKAVAAMASSTVSTAAPSITSSSSSSSSLSTITTNPPPPATLPFNLATTNASGASLLHLLIQLPTKELIRFQPHSEWLFQGIASCGEVLRRKIVVSGGKGCVPDRSMLDTLLSIHHPSADATSDTSADVEGDDDEDDGDEDGEGKHRRKDSRTGDFIYRLYRQMFAWVLTPSVPSSSSSSSSTSSSLSPTTLLHLPSVNTLLIHGLSQFHTRTQRDSYIRIFQMKRVRRVLRRYVLEKVDWKEEERREMEMEKGRKKKNILPSPLLPSLPLPSPLTNLNSDFYTILLTHPLRLREYLSHTTLTDTLHPLEREVSAPELRSVDLLAEARKLLVEARRQSCAARGLSPDHEVDDDASVICAQDVYDQIRQKEKLWRVQLYGNLQYEVAQQVNKTPSEVVMEYVRHQNQRAHNQDEAD